MARGLFRKRSFWKTIGAFRSQWKRALLRFFFPSYGKRGMGWLRNPKKAAYNWWYYRTSISIPRLLGYKPSRGACLLALCVVSVFSLFTFPYDAVFAGAKARKIYKARKARASGSSTRNSTTTKKKSESKTSSTTSKKISSSTRTAATRTNTSSPRTKATQPKPTTVKKTPAVTPTQAGEKKEESAVHTPSAPIVENQPVVTPPPSPEPKELDENTPKSKPKYEKDQYITKRLIIAGSSYCDPSVLAKLQIGTYFELSREPDNPHDPDAVVLTLEGEKIGYVGKKDLLPYTLSLNLHRKIYGVITDIITERHFTKYEYETWYDNNR